jgi:hypothetical protein
MFEGVLLSQKILEGPDVMNNIHRQIFVIDRNSIENMFDHSGKLIIHYQLGKIYCDAAFKHPQAINHVDPCQRGEQPGECLFMTRLGVT